MRNGVYPREEDNRPRRGHMEGNVLIKLNDAVQRRLSSQGDERPADWKENHGHIEMQNQRGSSSYRVCDAEGAPRDVKIVLDLIIHEAEREDHCMRYREDEDETDSKLAIISSRRLKTAPTIDDILRSPSTDRTSPAS